MKPHLRRRGNQEAQYAQRQAGLRMLLSGKYLHAEIAEARGVAHGTVRGWSSKLKAPDPVVKSKRVRGRPQGDGRSLAKAEERKIMGIVRDKNPRPMKMEFYLCSVGAVMALIEKMVGKSLSESSVGKYLASGGLTAQRPATRYSSRDDVLVQNWLNEIYPGIAVKAKKEDAQIHWRDETGVDHQAIYQRGYAPKGKTPIAAKPSKREKISMIWTVTKRGTMRFSVYQGGLKAPVLLGFLENLMKGATQKIFVIMDNLAAHKSKTVQAWLADRSEKIEVFFLPPYAPDLNPDEYLNNDLKQNVHRYSGLPTTKQALKSNVLSYLRPIQKTPAKVQSYFQAQETRYAASGMSTNIVRN